MSESTTDEEAVGLLQELGLKEYEARCFVTLTTLPHGTAKDISENTAVPRTRVYDAIRVLEAQGLVEIQHSNPRQFRAVAIDEAVSTLEKKYENRLSELRRALTSVEAADPTPSEDSVHEVWALSGSDAIDARIQSLLEDAQEEVILVVSADENLSPALLDAIGAAADRGIDAHVGAIDETTRDRLRDATIDVDVFETGLEWLVGETGDATVGRLLLVDGETLLISSFDVDVEEGREEDAVVAAGLTNGIVVITRRLVETGMLG
jgi:sugar-specific transcriptional regulator TrmB